MANDPGLQGFEVLTTDECCALLRSGCVGRVGFVSGGCPRVLPVNYAAAEDGAVVFRAGPTSSLADVEFQVVTFEIDGFDPQRRVGWSVCVTGQGREVTEAGDPVAERLHDLPVVSWAPGSRPRWFAILPDEITGRRLPMSPGDVGWIAGVVS